MRELKDEVLELQTELGDIDQAVRETKDIVATRTQELDQWLNEATQIVIELTRRVRHANLKEKGRVQHTRYTNTGFENAVRQQKFKDILGKF